MSSPLSFQRGRSAAVGFSSLAAALVISGCSSDTAESTAPPSVVAVDPAVIDTAVADYRVYVDEQIATMRSETDAFAAAIADGDLEQAQALYPVSRRPWERIEPIAGIIPGFDAAVDVREDDFDSPEDPGFTGWHRIEYHLWVDGDLAAAAPYAEQLASDLADLDAASDELAIEPQVLTVGAQELIEEVAAPSGKLSGEEDRYSGTDLYDFKANVEGSEALVDLLDPALQVADPDLAATLEVQFADLDAQLRELGSFREGFVVYAQVTDAQRSALAATLGELAESLSLLNGTLGLA
ncbi:iron uptake system protein EfeO [Nocardioides sp.]|uniref:iron uptake system protein EfeO n=1 Tax=Nocardioides sp. TaxID=35761 RepID=UPI002B2665E2|nr:iron uptake system protein EfeO [Nocardioides sp.]